ncbi:MAG: AsnC family protein [Candidatus Aenigmarchaeota archaeon]|nr:AsnC family protein [Candidatus Aenigmarchaeota archaeon]
MEKKKNTSDDIVIPHLKLLKILIEQGPKSPKQLIKATGMPETSVRERLKRIELTKIIHKLKDGPNAGKYAFYLYNDLEGKVEGLLKNKYTKHIEAGRIHPNLPVVVAAELGLADDAEYRKAFHNVFNRLATIGLNG